MGCAGSRPEVDTEAFLKAATAGDAAAVSRQLRLGVQPNSTSLNVTSKGSTALMLGPSKIWKRVRLLGPGLGLGGLSRTTAMAIL
jgi:hypothetical protein